MVRNDQESGRKYWATRLWIHLFAPTASTANSFVRSKLFALLSRSAALIHLFAHSLTSSFPRSWESESLNAETLGCSKPWCKRIKKRSNGHKSICFGISDGQNQKGVPSRDGGGFGGCARGMVTLVKLWWWWWRRWRWLTSSHYSEGRINHIT